MKRYWIVLLALFVLIPSSFAQQPEEKPLNITPEERETAVRAIAKAFDERYVFPEVAAKVKQTMEEQLANKGFDLLYLRPTFYKQFSEHRTMTVCFIRTITSHREVRLVRQCSQQINHHAGFRPAHLGSVLPGEAFPVCIASGLFCQLNRGGTGG